MTELISVNVAVGSKIWAMLQSDLGKEVQTDNALGAWVDTDPWTYPHPGNLWRIKPAPPPTAREVVDFLHHRLLPSATRSAGRNTEVQTLVQTEGWQELIERLAGWEASLEDPRARAPLDSSPSLRAFLFSFKGHWWRPATALVLASDQTEATALLNAKLLVSAPDLAAMTDLSCVEISTRESCAVVLDNGDD